MSQQLTAWNKRMNDLPRKAVLIALTLGLAALVWRLLPYVWPFAAGLLFSRILEPFVRLTSKGFLHLPIRRRRAAAALLGILLLFGLAGALAAILTNWLWQELAGLADSFPQLMQWINEQAVPALLSLYERYSLLLPRQFPQMMQEAITALGQQAVRWAAMLSARLTSGAWNTAASIPHAMLGVILTVMNTYYLTADRTRIEAFFRRTFPAEITKRSRLIRASLFGALMGQLRSQLMISLVIMFFLMLTLGISGIPHGAVIGMLIGAADVLPLMGAGLFLIPWSLASFLSGRGGMGMILICLYVSTVIIRQILEPRLVGRQLGLYPLAAMTAMYAGFRLLGFAGLLAGPVLLSLSKAVLDADAAVTQARS